MQSNTAKLIWGVTNALVFAFYLFLGGWLVHSHYPDALLPPFGFLHHRFDFSLFAPYASAAVPFVIHYGLVSYALLRQSSLRLLAVAASLWTGLVLIQFAVYGSLLLMAPSLLIFLADAVLLAVLFQNEKSASSTVQQEV